MNIGTMLRYYRRLYKLTQSEVAELSGINEKYLGRIERNESVPTIDKVEQLCMAFDIRIADLLSPSISFASVSDDGDYSDDRIKKIVYYCNCCGESFTSNETEIICPNCSCRYDSDNGYIERYVSSEFE